MTQWQVRMTVAYVVNLQNKVEEVKKSNGNIIDDKSSEMDANMSRSQPYYPESRMLLKRVLEKLISCSDVVKAHLAHIQIKSRGLKLSGR